MITLANALLYSRSMGQLVPYFFRIAMLFAWDKGGRDKLEGLVYL